MLKVLTKGCEPTRGSKYSAAVDLYASEDVVICAGETKLVGLGVAIDLDWNVIDYNFNHYVTKEQERIKDNFLKFHYLQLNPRSSLRAKGLISNTGIIDLDYTECEIKIIIHNPIKMSTNQGIPDQYLLKPYYIKKGDKIAQIMLMEHKGYLFGIDTEDVRSGGFGSTNKEEV